MPMETAKTAEGKNAGISLLRIFATLLVLGFHAVTVLEGRKEIFGTTSEQVVYVTAIRHLMNWHVPVFFMISGALLLDKKRKLTPAVCMKKYALRMLLALAVFGIPYACLTLIFESGSFSVGMIGQAVLNTVNGDNWDHMWFLYTMTGVYLFLPLLKRFTDNAAREEKIYILLLLLVYDFFIPIVDGVAGTHIGFASPVTFPMFYVLLGDFFSREEIPSWLQDKRICAGVLCLTAAVTALVNIFVPHLDRLFSGATSPVIALAGGSAFILFKDLSVPKRWHVRLWKLDRLCFGVYLVHPVFIHIVYRVLHLTPVQFGLYPLMIAVFYIGFAVMSFFASWVMSLIPPLKKYIL